MLNQDDLKLIEAKGITESTIDAQLKRFAAGFPALKIEAVATMPAFVEGIYRNNREICAGFGRGQPYVQGFVCLCQLGQE